MKELKKISLKEEVDKEAIQIEKEVMDRKDLDNISVSEEMETSLFNKIQDYEYDRRSKTVHRRKKKRYAVLALAAVLILVFGSTMTSVGSKPYWKVLWDRIAGKEDAQFINVEEMDVHETQDLDEVHIYVQKLYADPHMGTLLKGIRSVIISEDNLKLLGTTFSYDDYKKFYDEKFAPLEVPEDLRLDESGTIEIRTEENYPDEEYNNDGEYQDQPYETEETESGIIF